jgi:hypothetical protein
MSMNLRVFLQDGPKVTLHFTFTREREDRVEVQAGRQENRCSIADRDRGLEQCPDQFQGSPNFLSNVCRAREALGGKGGQSV